ncbi:hypothetical protein QJS10_CPB20g01877 [Acorus calamus]|uniref:Uncharacterized protein n=1 Tax=Acorus calamus TaxID=4465 RepID=A0AAV9CDJ0_ACOCL|nr:hypothetical protein QJS10_CPB20g01877 [Acorus calamus]
MARRHLLLSNNNNYNCCCFSTHQIRSIATADVKQQEELKEVARRVCDLIRRRPTWESTCLSEFPQEDLLHPFCIPALPLLDEMPTPNVFLGILCQRLGGIPRNDSGAEAC